MCLRCYKYSELIVLCGQETSTFMFWNDLSSWGCFVQCMYTLLVVELQLHYLLEVLEVSELEVISFIFYIVITFNSNVFFAFYEQKSHMHFVLRNFNCVFFPLVFHVLEVLAVFARSSIFKLQASCRTLSQILLASACTLQRWKVKTIFWTLSLWFICF